MPQGDIYLFIKVLQHKCWMLNFQHKNGCKGHQRSNLEWHYIQKLISPGVLFMWKISYLYQKQHRVGTMPLHYFTLQDLHLTYSIIQHSNMQFSVHAEENCVTMQYLVLYFKAWGQLSIRTHTCKPKILTCQVLQWAYNFSKTFYLYLHCMHGLIYSNQHALKIYSNHVLQA